jgi:hypothetical protein
LLLLLLPAQCAEHSSDFKKIHMPLPGTDRAEHHASKPGVTAVLPALPALHAAFSSTVTFNTAGSRHAAVLLLSLVLLLLLLLHSTASASR